MPSEWRVTSNFINGSKFYAVYRLKNVNAVDHSGNREYFTGFMPNRGQCEEICEKLNKEAAEK